MLGNGFTYCWNPASPCREEHSTWLTACATLRSGSGQGAENTFSKWSSRKSLGRLNVITRAGIWPEHCRYGGGFPWESWERVIRRKRHKNDWMFLAFSENTVLVLWLIWKKYIGKNKTFAAMQKPSLQIILKWTKKIKWYTNWWNMISFEIKWRISPNLAPQM